MRLLSRLIRKRKRKKDLSLDEVFLDTQNIPNFDTQQFEGYIEKPLEVKSLIILGSFLAVVFITFSVKLYSLQVVQGERYFQISESNRLDKTIIHPERGIIFDRNNTELAWNESNEESEVLGRRYEKASGFGFLGYVRYPKKDQYGHYWRDSIVGEAGIEKQFNDELSGIKGVAIAETSASGEVLSEQILTPPEAGENITLTLDADLQREFAKQITKSMKEEGYQGGAGVIMNIHTGEVLSLVSQPDISPQVMTDNVEVEVIQNYFTDSRTPFLNRVVSGVYTPGSILKMFIALAALQEGIITEHTTFMSDGDIEVPNRYDPENPARFRDWKTGGHGRTDVKHAIAESVNTFFYIVGGGYEGRTGLGIDRIYSYMQRFGFGSSTGIALPDEKVGVIPNPGWKREVFDDSWRLGDTYITAIGQFGFQVTPIQVARGIAAIANGGTLPIPIFRKDWPSVKAPAAVIDQKHYQLVREGMRQTVTNGTAHALNIRKVRVAAKTGTAQVGSNKEFVNSWITGFFPYDQPQYSFALVMERGPNTEEIKSASWVFRAFLEWMIAETPEYLGIETKIVKPLKVLPEPEPEPELELELEIEVEEVKEAEEPKSELGAEAEEVEEVEESEPELGGDEEEVAEIEEAQNPENVDVENPADTIESN